MRLILWHKVLIISGFAAAVLFGAWSIFSFAREGAISSLVIAGASFTVAGILVAYLRAVSRKLSRLEDSLGRRTRGSRGSTLRRPDSPASR